LYSSVAAESSIISVSGSALVGPEWIDTFTAVKTASGLYAVCDWRAPSQVSGFIVSSYDIYAYKNDSTTPESSVNAVNSPITFTGVNSPGTYRFSIVAKSGETLGTISPLSNPLTF
jgi:hypothetical protein